MHVCVCNRRVLYEIERYAKMCFRYTGSFTRSSLSCFFDLRCSSVPFAIYMMFFFLLLLLSILPVATVRLNFLLFTGFHLFLYSLGYLCSVSFLTYTLTQRCYSMNALRESEQIVRPGLIRLYSPTGAAKLLEELDWK